MSPGTVRIRRILWSDPDARQSTLELESPSGTRLTCLNDGAQFEEGSVRRVEAFEYLARRGSFEEIFGGNPNEEHGIENTGEWDCIAKGQVVAMQEDTPIVDCGGFLIPLDGLTHDRRVIGAWVAFRLERLEVEFG